MGLAFTYRREGWTVTARGTTSGYVRGDSMGLANNWLLVGNTVDLHPLCQFEGACFGDAIVFDLNRFAESGGGAEGVGGLDAVNRRPAAASGLRPRDRRS